MHPDTLVPIETQASITPQIAARADKPLKIAILSYRSAPHVGGQGIYVDYLSRALLDRGHTVHVLSGPPYPECDERVKLLKIPSLDLYEKPHNGHLELSFRHLLSRADTSEYFSHLTGRFSEPLTFSRRVAKHFKTNRTHYDVILDNQSLGAGLLSSAVQRTPFVGMIHHPITQDLKLALAAEERSKYRLLLRRWYSFHKEQIRVARRLPYLITPSEATKADFVREFDLQPDQLTVIPLGVDQNTFRPRPELERERYQIITTASSDVPLKGLIYLLQAVARVREIYPDVSVKVIGKLRDGPTAREISKLDLEKVVSFESGLTRDALAEAFCTASVSVTPSLYEGFGLPCAEAMSCGTPVITSDGGALPEVVGDAGTIVERGNSEALAQALIRFFSHSDATRKALADKALARAKREFDWARIAPKYEQIFQTAMDAKC